MIMEKTVTSAIAIIPPEHIWPQIQAIREKHDKQIKRWMPHINLIYPFIEEKHFDNCLHDIDSALRTMRSFNIAFTKDSFDHFKFGKSSTIFLNPLITPLEEPSSNSGSRPNSHPEVVELHRRLVTQFPDCSELDTISSAGYHPHLSLGQFPSAEVLSYKEKFAADWKDLQFQVREVSIISRADKDDPFHVRKYVQFS